MEENYDLETFKEVAEKVEIETEKPNVLDSVPVPKGLSAKQIKIAKHNAIERMKDGYTIGGFCKEFNVSTATFYKWLDIPEFNKYLTALSGAIIPDDEMQAYRMMKKHVAKLAYKQNPTPKEVELFMDVYGYLVEHDKRKQAEKLGLNKPVSDKADNRTVEEKRNALLNRLRN